MSKNNLVERIINKDESTFDQIYSEYNKLVFYVIYQIVKDQEITKDLVQETFLTVYNEFFYF